MPPKICVRSCILMHTLMPVFVSLPANAIRDRECVFFSFGKLCHFAIQFQNGVGVGTILIWYFGVAYTKGRAVYKCS